MEAVRRLYEGGETALSKDYQRYFDKWTLEEQKFGFDRSKEKQALLEKMENEPELAPFSIYKENELAFSLFQIVSTQWLVGMGGIYGLNYTAVIEIAERVLKIEMDSELFNRIRLCESASLSYFKESKKGKGKKNVSGSPSPPPPRRRRSRKR